MSDLADNDLQRMALKRLKARTVALREGFAKLTEQLANRTELLRNTIDASQAEAIGAIDDLSVKMRQREQKAQETFDRTLADISRRVLSIAVIFLGIIITAGVLIALSIRLPLQQIMAAMRAITSGRLRPPGAGHRPPRTKSARWRARWKCSARTPSPSARPKTSCALPRRRPRARCSNSTPPSRT